mmetsp:Transcript_27833/g.31586  ORF Transcript_27833/g.31586 Transcript_27833/m.31586 type:complete len:280 (-) Transcript_27833:48-887(-)
MSTTSLLFLFSLVIISIFGVECFIVGDALMLSSTSTLLSSSFPSSLLLRERYETISLSLSSESSPSSESESFPFTSEELIEFAKEYTTNPSPDWWDDDEFVFRGPVIGPLCKNDVIATLQANIDLSLAFPDLEMNAFGFTAEDPLEPNRVWYMVRPRGTFSGPFQHPTNGIIAPTNTPYVGPPETRSIVFNTKGKIKLQTVGYVSDRFTKGENTGGRGAIFGQYAVMGQYIDSNPGSWTTQFLQKITQYLPTKLNVPKSYSKREDLPDWWTDQRMGAEL